MEDIRGQDCEQKILFISLERAISRIMRDLVRQWMTKVTVVMCGMERFTCNEDGLGESVVLVVGGVKQEAKKRSRGKIKENDSWSYEIAKAKMLNRICLLGYLNVYTLPWTSCLKPEVRLHHLPCSPSDSKRNLAPAPNLVHSQKHLNKDRPERQSKGNSSWAAVSPPTVLHATPLRQSHPPSRVQPAAC